MILPRGFYYEQHHSVLGDKAYFVLRPISKREAAAAGVYYQERCAVMTNLYVHPKHRGNGVGKELLRLLKQWQNKTQTHVVFLVSPYSKKNNLDIWCLKNFYSTHGFPEIEGTAYHGRIV